MTVGPYVVILLYMTTTQTKTIRPYRHAERRHIIAAIRYWSNCLGKGTSAQRDLTERTIHELSARLEAIG